MRELEIKMSSRDSSVGSSGMSCWMTWDQIDGTFENASKMEWS